MALSRLRLLYLFDTSSSPSTTIKVIGYQWYWGYEYPDFPEASFDRYIEAGVGGRLLEVDNRVVLPGQVGVRLLATSSDVIHCWSVPAIGVKIDAIPGRLNQSFLGRGVRGIFYGQCSEICGANHSFMPIRVEVVGVSQFLGWVRDF